MGLGKTLMSVEYAKRKGAEVIIVVLPLNTRGSWTETIKLQIPDADVYRLDTKNKAGMKAFGYLAAGKPGWYLIGWELMRTGAITGHSVDLAIADETHKQANYGRSKQSDYMRLFSAKWKVALSGTPSANRPEGIFSTLNWLWPDKYTSLYNWIDKFWVQRRNGAVVDLLREINPGAIIRDIPMFTRRLRKDHRDDMPDVLPEIVVEVELTPAQRKLYKQFDELALAWVDGMPVSAAYPLEQDIRLRQIALGACSYDEDNGITFELNAKSAKINSIIEIAQTDELRDDTFLVLVHSARFIPTIVHQLNKAGIKAEAFYGATTGPERERLIAEMGSTYRVLVAGIAAIGEGVDGLQHHCHNMIWASKHPNALLNTQASGRLDRPGQQEVINVWNLVALDTRDQQGIDKLNDIKNSLDEMIDNHR